MKKIIALLLVCVSLFLQTEAGAYAEEYSADTEFSDGTVAYVIFDEQTVTKGMRIAVGDENNHVIVMQNGKRGLVLDPALSNKNRYLYIDVDDKLMYNFSDGTGFDVEIEYFDAQTGSLTLKYPYYYSWDSTKAADASPTSAGKNVTKELEILDFADTQSWRTYSWYLPDATMKNSLNGYDFLIGIYGEQMSYSKGKTIIRSVKVKKRKTYDRINIDISSASLGNIFFTGDEMTLDCTFDNSKYPFFAKRDGKYTVEAKYSLIDSSGNVAETQTETFELEPLKKNTRKITFNPKKYDCYKLKVEALCEEKRTSGETTADCSYVRSTKGKIKNPRAGISIATESGTEYAERYAELVENAGFTYARLHLARVGWAGWAAYDRTDVTELAMPKGHDKILKSMISHGIKITAYESFDWQHNMPAGYEKDGKFLPHTREGIDRFLNSQYIYLDKMGDSLAMYELYNEVGNNAFSRGFNGALAAEALHEVVPKIKEKYPNLLISAPQDNISHAGGSTFTFVQTFVEEGGADDVDIYSVHPYSIPSVARTRVENLKDIRRVVDTHNKDAELWATEYGMPAYSDGCETEYKQAWANVLATLIFYEDNIIPKYFLFRLDNAENEPRNNREAHFGVVHSFSPYYKGTRGAAKPQYLAMSNMNIEMADAEYAGRIDPEKGVTIGYRYRKTESGEDMAVLFTDKLQTQTTLDLGTNELTVVDLYGNEKKLRSDDGVYTFSFSIVPQYIKGHFTKFDIKEDSRVYLSKCEIESAEGNDSFVIYNKTGKKLKADFTLLPGSEIKIPESIELDGEECTVKFDSGSIPAVKNEPIHIVISGESGIYYEGDIRINKKVDINMYSAMRLNAENGWDLDVTLENNLRAGEINGKLQFVAPESWAKLIAPIDVNIKAGETKVVKIPMPKEAEEEKGNNTTLAFVADEKTGNGVYKTQKYDFAYFNKVHTPVTIDGDLSEWPDAWITADQPEQFLSVWGVYNQYGGVGDISAKMQVMWDEDNFYFGSEVHDDVFYTEGADPSTMWMVDDYQLGIAYDPKDELGSNKYEELSFALLNGKPELYRHATAMVLADMTQVKDYELQIVRDEEKKTTTYELRVPWSSLINDFKDKKMSEGREIKFAALLNENDGTGRKGYYTVGTGIHDTKTTTNFLRFSLADIEK